MLQRAALAAGVAVLVAGALVHAFHGYSHEDLSGHAIGSDDAYISYRYARSLATGHGLTFNPGERVEGYSNLLHVALLAPVFLFARDAAAHPVSVALSLIFAVAALALFHRRVRARHGPLAAAAAALLFAAWPALWLWTASGMETALVLLLQVALWAEVTREDGEDEARALIVVIVLLVLARADGFVSAGLGVTFLALRGDRRARAASIALAASMAVLVAIRLVYYGHPLPNTYYAKVSGPLAARIADASGQLADLALQAGLLPYLVILVVAAFGWRGRRPPYEPLFAAGWLAYWIYVGGDVFGERFLLVLVPLGAAVLARWIADGRRGLAAVALGVALLFQVAPLVSDRRFRYASARYDRWVELGRLLSHPEHRGRTLAIDAAGKAPYYSRLPTIDMLGLTDAHIGHRPAARFSVGHNKHDADYVLSRNPDFIATWIDEGLDLRWDLPRARYEAAGYRLRWLLYARRFPPADRAAIVDVRSLDAAEVQRLVSEGWQYAVVERAR